MARQANIVSKKCTPTMGGLLILSARSVATRCGPDLTTKYVWIVLIITVTFGERVGLWNDSSRSPSSSKGVPGRRHLAVRWSVARPAPINIAHFPPPALLYLWPVRPEDGLIPDRAGRLHLPLPCW